MPIHIVPAREPVVIRQLTMLLYGQPGVGKTTAAMTSNAPLLLDFDGGIHRAAISGPRVDAKNWTDASNITPEEIAEVDTIVIDTFGKALQALTEHIAATTTGSRKADGELTVQGWGRLRRQFNAWLRSLHQMNKDIIILAHSEVFNQGDQTAERPLAPGGAKNDVYQMCDQIGLIYNLADRNSEGGMRQIMWDPTDTAIGKNSGELEPTAIPPVSEDTQFLSRAIADIKANINRRSLVNQSVSMANRELRTSLGEMTTADQLTEAANRMRAENRPVTERRMLTARAQELGYAYHRESGAFIPTATPAPAIETPVTPVAMPEPEPTLPETAVEPFPELDEDEAETFEIDGVNSF